MAWVLNLLYGVLIAALAPALIYRRLVGKKVLGDWRQKLWGAVPARASDRPCVWLHAVSVGEVVQLQPVLAALAQCDPEYEFVISTTTSTGYDVARKHYPQHAVCYFPLDFSWAVNRALDRIRPTALVLVELELWPNLILAAAARRIPISLINGRISERSFRGYRWIRPLMRLLLRRLACIAVQNATYAARFVSLGADPEQITITGSIKFDRVQTNRDNPKTLELRRALQLRPGEPVFIAGSTQAPEEQFALEAYQTLRQQHPNLRLVLVPRHKERFEEVARLVESSGVSLLRRSQSLAASAGVEKQIPIESLTRSVSLPSPLVGEGPGVRGGADAHSADSQRESNALGAPRCFDPRQGGTESARTSPVLLLDTLGELSACWGLADVAFVGGSLGRRGGQNMIEPAGYGAAVLFGPNTQNFRDVVGMLLDAEAARVVHHQAELTSAVGRLLEHRAEGAELGRRAQALVLAQQGATARTVELIIQTFAGCPGQKTKALARAA